MLVYQSVWHRGNMDGAPKSAGLPRFQINPAGTTGDFGSEIVAMDGMLMPYLMKKIPSKSWYLRVARFHQISSDFIRFHQISRCWNCWGPFDGVMSVTGDGIRWCAVILCWGCWAPCHKLITHETHSPSQVSPSRFKAFCWYWLIIIDPSSYCTLWPNIATVWTITMNIYEHTR